MTNENLFKGFIEKKTGGVNDIPKRKVKTRRREY